MWTYIVFGASYAFAAAVQPGPFQTYLIAETMSRGWRRTLPAAMAPLLSDAPVIAITLLILSRVSVGMVRALHVVGALFLFYLSYKAYQSWRAFSSERAPEIPAGHRTLVRAAFVNFLNPNPWLGWSLVMGPLFLEGYREAPSHGIALIAGFYGTMVCCLVGLITVFAFARSLGPRINRITLGLSVAALACFGLYQMWLGIYK